MEGAFQVWGLFRRRYSCGGRFSGWRLYFFGVDTAVEGDIWVDGCAFSASIQLWRVIFGLAAVLFSYQHSREVQKINLWLCDYTAAVAENRSYGCKLVVMPQPWWPKMKVVGVKTNFMYIRFFE